MQWRWKRFKRTGCFVDTIPIGKRRNRRSCIGCDTDRYIDFRYCCSRCRRHVDEYRHSARDKRQRNRYRLGGRYNARRDTRSFRRTATRLDTGYGRSRTDVPGLCFFHIERSPHIRVNPYVQLRTPRHGLTERCERIYRRAFSRRGRMDRTAHLGARHRKRTNGNRSSV